MLIRINGGSDGRTMWMKERAIEFKFRKTDCEMRRMIQMGGTNPWSTRYMGQLLLPVHAAISVGSHTALAGSNIESFIQSNNS